MNATGMPRHWLRWLIAGFVTTADHGLLEFLLVFTRSQATGP